jgi:hypothetical protein
VRLFQTYAKLNLNFADVSRLRTFLAFSYVKAYTISFSERLETVALDLGKVYKYVRTVVLLNETKTLCVVEPLYCTFCHFFLHVPYWESVLVCKLRTPRK